MDFCRDCGCALSGGCKFCPSCGKALGAAGAGAPVAASPVTPPPPAPPLAASVQAAANTLAQGTGVLNTFRQGLMSPEAFLQAARTLPWGKRPQAWWDMLAILGGAVSGGLWFLYSSVRATQAGGWFTLALLLPLVAAFFFKQQAARLVSPVWTRVQKWPLVGKIAGLVGIGFGLNAIPQHEGLDFISPLLMVALPALLVWFRPQIDRLLQGLRPMLGRIPLAARVGMGLALPFVTAFILYNGLGFRMYPLMRVNMVVGTLLSYALIRTPATGSGGGSAATLVRAGVWILLVAVLCPATGWADDFLRDPFNLNDGLRTDGIAPLIAGASTAIVTMLVNGVPVAQTVIQSRNPAGPGEQPQHEDFQVVVETKDKMGARSTIVSEGDGYVRFFAHCEKAGTRFPSGDATISFTLVSGAPYIELIDEAVQGGERCARVKLADPQPAAGNPPSTCSVQVSAGSDGLIGYTVELQVADMELEFF